MEENLHILLIEDNAAEAILLQESLAQIECPPEVLHAEKLEEALSCLKTKTVNAILLDLALPDSDGLSTLERMNAAADYLPIIVLTGLEDEYVAIEAVRKGAQDYLIKGQTGARQLMQTILRAVERKRLERALAQSAQRNLMLAEISAKVAAQTELDGLLPTVVEAACKLTSARVCCSCAMYERGRSRFCKSSQTGGVVNQVLEQTCQNKDVIMDLVRQCDSARLSSEELRGHGRCWELPEPLSSLKGLICTRLVGVHGQATGSIVVSDKERGEEFTGEDEAYLKQLAFIASLALQHIESRKAAEAASIAKSQFLANMSHELRTPMNAIIGMTGLALAEELPPAVRDYLQTSKDSAEILLGILNEILDLSRIEAGRFELESTVFNLHKVVEQAIKILRVRAGEKGLALICSLAADVPELLVGDPLRFRQILINLVDNAIKFTHAGKIAVKAEVQEKTPESVMLQFSVSDTGIGIRPEDRERIFSPFTQADASTTRNYGGTGLGLTISRKLVELMGGQIWVDSLPDQGSTFHFTVALKMPQEIAVEKREAARDQSAPVERRALRVLLAEDTPTNQKLAAYLLQKRGHFVEIARNGRRAVELVEQHDFDVVLMDVQMPIMDGFQATSAIRALGDIAKARVPIIAITAHALKEDAERCLAAGMDGYVSKPIQADEFIELVELLGDMDSGEIQTPGKISAEKAAPFFNLNEAIQKCFGKYEFFVDVARAFAKEAPDSMRGMRDACEQGNSKAVQDAAHRLKNTVIYLGSHLTMDALHSVENTAKSGDRTALGEALDQLELCLESLKTSLAKF